MSFERSRHNVKCQVWSCIDSITQNISIPVNMLLAENAILVKNRYEVVRIMTSWLRDLVWSYQFCPSKVAQGASHCLCKISAQSVHRLGGHFRKTQRGASLIPHAVPASVRTFIRLAEAHIWGSEKLVLEIRSSNVIYVCDCLRCVSSFLSSPFSFSGIAWCAAWAYLLQSNLVFLSTAEPVVAVFGTTWGGHSSSWPAWLSQVI